MTATIRSLATVSLSRWAPHRDYAPRLGYFHPLARPWTWYFPDWRVPPLRRDAPGHRPRCLHRVCSSRWHRPYCRRPPTRSGAATPQGIHPAKSPAGEGQKCRRLTDALETGNTEHSAKSWAEGVFLLSETLLRFRAGLFFCSRMGVHEWAFTSNTAWS
jgi:hypothetical protein